MEAPSLKTIIKVILPQFPSLLRTAVLHATWLSATSTKWDLRTALIINVLRSILNSSSPSPLSRIQRFSLKDPGVKGRMWISRVTLSAPVEDDIRQILLRAIDELKESPGETYAVPELRAVEAEWTGYRPDVGDEEPEPSISEEEKYKNLMSEASSPVTMIYLHGGAYYLMDPASYRTQVSRLAKLTKGRALNVRYRLAPQNPFPAALLDAFMAYLSLLYPLPGSLHEPVPASNIVFTGDSAGANLSLALLHLILHIRRSANSKITFHGQQVEIPVPAGVATNSAWCDVTRCLPSLEQNAIYDYLPAPSRSAHVSFPPDEIWPTDPPRDEVYCETSMFCHPLISPLSCTPSQWAGSPPLLFLSGEEMLADEIKIVASRAASQGVAVKYEQYEAMPHTFAMLLDHLDASKMCYAHWADFMRECVEGKHVKSEAIWVKAKSLEVKQLDLATIADEFPEEVVRERMRKAREARERGDEAEGKAEPMPKL